MTEPLSDYWSWQNKPQPTESKNLFAPTLIAENDSALVDTNIFVYLIDDSDPEKHRRAIRFLEGQFKNRKRFLICMQNIREFAAVTIRKHSIQPEKLNEIMDLLFSLKKILHENPTDVQNAVSWHFHRQTPFWDSLLACTMQRHGINTIYTENERDFKKLGLRVINPLK